MFRVPDILESRHDDDFLILDYRSGRGINGRDSVPEKQARLERISAERAEAATRGGRRRNFRRRFQPHQESRGSQWRALHFS